MNQRQFSPNQFNNGIQYPQNNYNPGRSMNSPSNQWQSPSSRNPTPPYYKPRGGYLNGSSSSIPFPGGPSNSPGPMRHWRGNNASPHNHSFSSPNLRNFSPRKSSNTSTPRHSSGNNTSSDSSGFLPFTSSPSQYRSPYDRRDNFSQSRRSFNNSFSPQNQQKPPVEAYFKHSMLQDPWKTCKISSIAEKDAKKSAVSSKSRRYFSN